MSKKKDSMSFHEALSQTLQGERITRLSWEDDGVYGFIVNGILTIRRNFKFHQWVLAEEDITANDWIII